MKIKLIFILLSCFFSSILYAETITVISTPPTIDGVQGTPTKNTLTRAKGKVINITAKPKEGFRGVITIDGVVIASGEMDSAFRYKHTIVKDSKIEVSYDFSTGFIGRILDANDAEKGILTPIVNTTISFLKTGQSTQSDDQGYFSLSDLPSGNQVLDIDSSTANAASNGDTYASFRENYNIVRQAGNINARPFYMPRLNTSSLSKVDPTRTTSVTNTDVAVSLSVPPNTAKNADGSNFTGQLSISLVPRNLAPATLPENIDPALLVTIQPVGVTFSTPVPLTFPNIDNLSAGSEVDIWSVDPEMGTFVVVGKAQVTSDGQSIETISGGVRAADWHTLLPTPPGLSPETPETEAPTKDCSENTVASTSTITTSSGCLNTDFDLPRYYSQGQERGLSFIYKSERAYPIKALPFDVNISSRSAIPRQISYETYIDGTKLTDETFISTIGLTGGTNETLRAVSYFDASQLKTGIYPYKTRVINNYAQSRVSTDLTNRSVVINEQNSSFGAGWGLVGLSRLIVNDSDGRVLIYDGNGRHTAYEFGRLDLNQWRQTGNLNDGNWEVSDDGLSVLQTINVYKNVGNPTFFISPEDKINTTVKGKFRIETTNDDDWVGFVFGYQSPNNNNDNYDFLLFDWKKNNQEGGKEGFTLARVKGNNADFWEHTPSDDLEIIATNYADDLGWLPNTDYEFELTYTTNKIIIRINGQTIFNQSGSFNSGQFGFYNYSQANVRYESFSSTEVFDTPDGDYTTLNKKNDGSYIRTLKTGTQVHFDSAGLQTKVIDRNGNATLYAYNSQQQLISITDPVGKITKFTYKRNYLTSITDPLGRISQYQYDAKGNLTKITFPDGTSKQFGYDNRHLMTSEIDQRGFKATRTYDNVGRINGATRADGSVHVASNAQTMGLTLLSSGVGSTDNPATLVRPEEVASSFTDGEGHTKTSKTDSFGRLTQQTDANGLTTTFDRDNHGNPIKITRPDGSIVSRTFDESGNLLTKIEGFNDATTHYTYTPDYNLVTSKTDALGNKTKFIYDNQGNITQIINALGQITTLTYNSTGQIEQLTDVNGFVTQYSYNAAGLPQTITETPLEGTARQSQLVYNDIGLAEKITTSPNGTVINLTYDSHGRLSSLVDTLAQKIEYQYDKAGNRTQTKTYETNNNLTSIASQTFDALNRLTSISEPHTDTENATQHFTYNGVDDIAETTDAKGNKTSYRYDEGNRLVEQVNALLDSTYFSYDNNGQVIQTTAPNNSTTNYVNDALGRVTKEISPDRGEINYSYDKNNNLKTVTDARGITTNYDYDALNRLIQIRYPSSSENVILTYDNCSFGVTRLCSVNDESGTTTNSYDGYGNVAEIVTVREGVSYSQGYQYDNWHRLVNMTLVSGRVINYQRDSLQRVTSINTKINNVNQNVLSAVTYNANGQVTGQKYGNNLTETQNYDLQGRLLKRDLAGVDLNNLSYDLNSNVLIRKTSAENHSYSYDILDRLVNENNNNIVTQYTYDANANRLSIDGNGQRLTYDYSPMSNQLLNIDTKSIRHDAAGNQLQDDQGRQYEYNNAGRLIQIKDATGEVLASYRYNANGQRTYKQIGTNAVIYHYDLAGHLASETLADGSLIRDYLWLGDTPLAQVDKDSSETLSYLHTDHLNTPRLATSQNKAVVWRWEGDAFGKQPVQEIAMEVNLRFPGQYFDAESGLHYNWNRYYNPLTGRYVTSDPIGLSGGVNTYGYVFQNPIINTDSTGLCFGVCTTIIGAIIVRQAVISTGRAIVGVAGRAIVGVAGRAILDRSNDTKQCKNGDDKPSKADCNKAKKLLKNVIRLSEKNGKKLPNSRKKQLFDKIKNGSITSNDLPGSIQGEFPSKLKGKSLAEIEAICK